MTSKTATRIRSIYAVSVSAMLVIAGICLMAACLGIYLSGDEPYSRDAVAAAFSPIAIPVYLCLVLVLLGFVLEWVLPKEEKRRTVEKQRKLILFKLHDRADMSQCDSALRAQIQHQQRIRLISRIIAIVLLCMGCLVFLAYILSADRFPLDDVNGSVFRAVVTLLLCMMIPFGYAIVNAYWSLHSMDKEIALLKQVPKLPPHMPYQVAKRIPDLLPPRFAILAAGIALLVYGFLNGGTADVLVKAINICTECVGLG